MAKKIAESPAELAWNGITGGVVHELPEDLGAALADDAEVLALWESLTPLGRNEFICWVSDAKKPETRARRIRRTREELEEGKRRPCCWPAAESRRPPGARRARPGPPGPPARRAARPMAGRRASPS